MTLKDLLIEKKVLTQYTIDQLERIDELCSYIDKCPDGEEYMSEVWDALKISRQNIYQRIGIDVVKIIEQEKLKSQTNVRGSMYTKRWQVAHLFLRDLMKEHPFSDNIEWKPIHELKREKTFELIWAKTLDGMIFKAFHFKTPPYYFYYAEKCELAPDIHWFSVIGDGECI